MRRNRLPRILLTILGAALIALGIGRLALGVVGEQGTAIITSIRRQGGEITAGRSGRYIYQVGYSFRLPDGHSVDGWTTRVGDAGHVKADGKSTMLVRYLKALPVVNAPESSTRLSLGQPILVAVGIFLIAAMNGGGKKRRRG